jgi:predicted transcriptional regulator
MASARVTEACTRLNFYEYFRCSVLVLLISGSEPAYVASLNTPEPNIHTIGVDNRTSKVSDQISSPSSSNHIGLAADIVAAFVSNNSVPVGELPALIASIHGALQNVANPAQKQAPVNLTPAVPIKKSITPDAIYSLEDGKGYKSMKRHLARLGMTPQQYREKWGLPRDYPMVAPSYAAKRSELAKNAGLGQQRRKVAAKSADTSETVSAPAPKKKSSRKKAA